MRHQLLKKDRSYLVESIKSLEDKLEYIIRFTSSHLCLYASRHFEGFLYHRLRMCIHSPYITQKDKIEYINTLRAVIIKYSGLLPTMKLQTESRKLLNPDFSTERYVESITQTMNQTWHQEHEHLLLGMESRLIYRMEKILAFFSCGRKKCEHKQRIRRLKLIIRRCREIKKRLLRKILNFN